MIRADLLTVSFVLVMNGLASAAPGAPAAASTTPATQVVVLTSDSATFDMVHSIYELIGHAKAVRTATKDKSPAAATTGRLAHGVLTSERMLYQHRARFLRATGNVVFEDPEYVVHSGVMEYDVGREWLSATLSPSALIHLTGKGAAGEASKPAGRATTESASSGGTRTTVTAQVLSFDRKRQRVVAEGDVRTHVMPEGKAAYYIRSRELESFYADRRSVFKGEVRIDSRELGAQGDRAIFYEKTEKMYIIGHAKAWQIDAAGRRGREVEGNQILHDLKTGRSVALQGVTMRERPSGAAPAAAKPPGNRTRKTLRLR
ncbi:MAG: hypothetical protein HY303_16080 [Candidatus Wallbacteria bacterium]|nr:hypothetical protein [Candidatus Wallbacteria bacterium]